MRLLRAQVCCSQVLAVTPAHGWKLQAVCLLLL